MAGLEAFMGTAIMLFCIYLIVRGIADEFHSYYG